MYRLLHILWMVPFWLSGQNMQIVETPVVITEGTIMSVDEDFVNTGDVLNQGQLFVGGNWVNAGIYRSEGVALLEFNGAGDQMISDESVIDYLRMSGGNKTLMANLAVNRLELDGSILTVEDEYSLEIPPSGSITRNPYDYIIGRLVMTGENIYPLGTEDRYLPVSLVPLTDTPTPVGIKAVGTELQGPLPEAVAGLAPFHWVMDESEDIFQVQPAFEDADFLSGSVLNAIVVQSESENGEIQSLFQGTIQGDLDSVTVSNAPAFPLSLPYFSIGRKFLAEDRPPLKVYNLVSPNDDGINDFLYIENLDAYPGCTISIYDRWGTLVFSQTGYDNRENVFRGQNNQLNKKEVIQGTYYYVIRYQGEKLARGFFELTR